MFFKEYIEQAVKTESNDFDVVGGRLNNKHVVRLLHAGLGMATEASELFKAIYKQDIINVREEIGDLFWYIAIAHDASSDYFHYRNYTYLPFEDWWVGLSYYAMEHRLLCSIGEFVDAIKKNIFYGKALEKKEVLSTLQDIFNCVYWIIDTFDGFDLDSILSDNIKKLKSRYGELFSEERALNRDVENELNHMKDKA